MRQKLMNRFSKSMFSEQAKNSLLWKQVGQKCLCRFIYLIFGAICDRSHDNIFNITEKIRGICLIDCLGD